MIDHDEAAPAPSETREPASAAVEDAHAQELDELARQYDERHGTNGKNQPFAWAAPLQETAEPESASQPEPASQLEPATEPEPASEPEQAAAEPTAQVETEAAADEPTEPIPTLAAQPSGDASQRALDLLDELRSLIPNLGSANGAGATDIRAILLEANVPANDSGDLEQLRAAIDTANNRPRDIDVMLDLVSRAAAIQAVIDERDRFAAAIGKALAATDHADK